MLAAVTAVNWSTIRLYSPDDFKHPEKLEDSVVRGLDLLAARLPIRPIPIDDYRFYSVNVKSQHALGRAIDFVVPGVDSLDVLAAIRDVRAFSGYGMYTNENNVQSFHVDTRVDRDTDDPATWGAWRDRTAGVTAWQYVGLSQIVYMVKKNVSTIWPILLIGLALWFLSKRA